MKIIITFALLLASTSFSFSQEAEVKIKKKIVYIDGIQTFKREVEGPNVTIKDLDGNDLIYMKNYDETNRYINDDYLKIQFLDAKKSLTTTYIFWPKPLIKKLIEMGIIVDGKIVDGPSLDQFILKYDENIENGNVNININIQDN